ncbi:hypothetical protein BpHYR1_044290 [Brachionus plicatilis]|uniref:Uncharacterized protein n=1 Tax=Brachionus plicatilis TaxID=10195 RepID=A0A3M7PD67_BRAPC|nr:hypothetical protein BpHYR1_044290 [Brachionus plicatilis]
MNGLFARSKTTTLSEFRQTDFKILICILENLEKRMQIFLKSVCRNSDSAVVLLRANLTLLSNTFFSLFKLILINLAVLIRLKEKNYFNSFHLKIDKQFQFRPFLILTILNTE